MAPAEEVLAEHGPFQAGAPGARAARRRLASVKENPDGAPAGAGEALPAN
jgi:hypothetical protein